VPSLLTGAAFGRIIGQFVKAHIDSDIDPGVYALVGASAFLAGMARITISLTVILMECSRSVQNGLPIMLTVMFAKWAGDLFNVGLYDIHIELEGVPFLEPFPEDEHRVLEVQDVMSPTVDVIPECVRLDKLIALLRHNKHSTFPVVDDDESCHFRGLMRRNYITGILYVGKENLLQKSASAAPGDQPGMLKMEELMRLFPTFPTVDKAIESWYDPQEHGHLYLDLKNYHNHEPYYTGPTASLARAYHLFRGMGLRCLPVVDRDHKVIGIITRQDLLHEALHEGLHFAEQRNPDLVQRVDKDRVSFPSTHGH
jgi:chloride channel 7